MRLRRVILMLVVVVVVAGCSGDARAERECRQRHDDFLDYTFADPQGDEPPAPDPIWDELRRCAEDGRLATDNLNDPELWVPPDSSGDAIPGG